jgi:hypothetical protein
MDRGQSHLPLLVGPDNTLQTNTTGLLTGSQKTPAAGQRSASLSHLVGFDSDQVPRIFRCEYGLGCRHHRTIWLMIEPARHYIGIFAN